MTGISKSQVSRLCAEIDDKIATSSTGRSKETGPNVWLDATYVDHVKARQNGRIVSVAVITAIGVNGDGRREVLCMAIGPRKSKRSGRPRQVVSFLPPRTP